MVHVASIVLAWFYYLEGRAEDVWTMVGAVARGSLAHGYVPFFLILLPLTNE